MANIIKTTYCFFAILNCSATAFAISINKQGIYNITFAIKLNINPIPPCELGLNSMFNVCIFRLKTTITSAISPINNIKLISVMT